MKASVELREESRPGHLHVTMPPLRLDSRFRLLEAKRCCRANLEKLANHLRI